MKRSSLLRAAMLAGLLLAHGAMQAKELVVAQVAPFGGPLAVSGRDFNLGAGIAFDEVNANGGAGGHRIRLVSRDDGYRSVDTVRHVEELLDKEQPLALIGMWGADNVEAVLRRELLDRSGLPVLGVRSGVAALRSHASIFHLRASYRDEVQRIVQQVQTMGSTRLAVMYEDDGYGLEALAEAQRLLAQASLKPVAVARLPRNDVHVDAAVASVAQSSAQAVLLVANTPVAAAVVKGLRARKVQAFIFATSTVDAEQLVGQLGALASGVSVAQGVPNPYKATAPIAMAFRQRVRALGIDAARVNFASMEGYITARVLAEAIRRAGREPNRRELVRALESMQRTDLGGFHVNFGPGRREGSQYVDLSMVSADGRIRQ